MVARPTCASVQVTSVDHPDAADGNYFNIPISAVEGRVGLPSKWADGEAVDVIARQDRTGKVGVVKLRPWSAKSKQGECHGRWTNDAQPGDWQAHDTFKMLHVICEDEHLDATGAVVACLSEASAENVRLKGELANIERKFHMCEQEKGELERQNVNLKRKLEDVPLPGQRRCLASAAIGMGVGAVTTMAVTTGAPLGAGVAMAATASTFLSAAKPAEHLGYLYSNLTSNPNLSAAQDMAALMASSVAQRFHKVIVLPMGSGSELI